MRVFAKNAARPWGFTLVELLTVIAIVAVLATLLSASLGSAKRKARKTASISNLRQLALGFSLYQDDHQHRPFFFRELVEKNYLKSKILGCPEDRTEGKNWAGAASISGGIGRVVPGAGAGDNFVSPQDLSHSYFRSFNWVDELWQELQKQPLGGIAACQLHGVGRPRWEQPAVSQVQGIVLRALKDGAVIHRQVYWKTEPSVGGAMPVGISPGFVASDSPFFLDPVE